MPRMPFIGVRISWLICARKLDFARFAASACSLAARSASSFRTRCVISRATTTRPADFTVGRRRAPPTRLDRNQLAFLVAAAIGDERLALGADFFRRRFERRQIVWMNAVFDLGADQLFRLIAVEAPRRRRHVNGLAVAGQGDEI